VAAFAGADNVGHVGVGGHHAKRIFGFVAFIEPVLTAH
jgi:hypothetical protein